MLAISRSNISSWLLSKIDPDEFDDVNIDAASPESDPVYRQVRRFQNFDNP